MLPVALSNGEVIILVVLVAVPIAALAFMGAGAVYREIGRGPFAVDRDPGPGRGSGSDSEAARAHESREELRQLLEAKAFRQARRGEPTLDVELELARLAQAPPPDSSHTSDPGLVEEVRSLVLARNERRQRRGEEPLDVESEVARRLAELKDLGGS